MFDVKVFDDTLQEDILKHAGRWILEENCIYNSYSGLSNNASE